MSKLGSSIGRQPGVMGTGWKKEPWEKLSAQPASTTSAAYQGSLGQTAPSYAPGAQIMGRTEPKKQTEPEKQEKPSDVGTADVGTADVGTADVGAADVGAADVGAAVPSGPSTFSHHFLLPSPYPGREKQ